MTEVTDPSQLLAQENIEEAEAAGERRLDTHPDDVAALNVVALGALRRVDPLRARALLERAALLAPNDATTHYHLGRAREATGDPVGALAADEIAVRAAPGHGLARLHYALGLERHGDTERSVLQFTRALKDSQSSGQWTNAASTPAALRPRVEHAVQVVRRSQQATFHRLLA